MLRDIDYVVDEGKVKIVDGLLDVSWKVVVTGWSSPRIEAKEGVGETSLRQWRQSLTKTTSVGMYQIVRDDRYCEALKRENLEKSTT